MTHDSMNLPQSTIADFQNDGVTLLRGIFRDWVEPLCEGVTEVMSHPSPLERSYHPKDGSAAFFQDFCNWQRIPQFRAFVFESPAAEVAAHLMGSPTSRFFHDHILVKYPGNSTVTPWHHDQPYYCVEGERTVSFWTPLDKVSREISLQCVAGSHAWNKAGYRPKRFDGSPLYPNDPSTDVPDIEANRGHLLIRSWDLEPGDAVAFDFRTLHGAPANTSRAMRRVFSSRWVGFDARFVRRGAAGSPPFPHVRLEDGAPFDAVDFPLVYRRP
jgi:ectoine hydroxylase-related dioxygenase (phytanoyl-CoA dioxygenase family)